MVECPRSIEELEEILRIAPLCRKELYEQAKARIETGVAESLHDASRQIADETGRKPESIERSIQREQEQQGVTLSPLSQKYKSNEQFRTSFTGQNEWYTPIKYVNSAREVMGDIDLDPASSKFGQSRINAKSYYTKEDNGLMKPWFGRVWLNPPYSQPLVHLFIEKITNEFKIGSISEAIILTYNYTDTAWFHMAESVCSAICFTKGRIRFEDTESDLASPTQGSVFFYFGDNLDKFKEVFIKFGFIR